jgi:hypothetical protein
MDLPGRDELRERVRYFKVESYEVEDLIQECYVCLLDPDSDGDIEKHLRRLQNKRNNRRKFQAVVRRDNRVEFDELAGDDLVCRTQQDIEALTLLIAARSECDDRDGETLELVAGGAGYRTLCREWKVNKVAARVRVLRFRKRLYPKLFEENY